MRLATGILFALLLCGAATADKPAKEKTRNPFGVKDIEDPDGEDVFDLIKMVELKGDAKDANVEQWVTDATEGKKGSLDGEWFERWNHNGQDGWSTGKSTTKIKTVDERVYLLIESSNGQFLMDLKYDKKARSMAGRYRGITNENDTGPCVFKVVDDERIDGSWRGVGRWDFRRKLKQEK
jgi:hypothetical protein